MELWALGRVSFRSIVFSTSALTSVLHLSYFEPLHLPCSDPLIGDDRRAPLAPVTGDPPLAFISLNGSAPAWTASPHVIWSQRRLDYLDQCILDLYTRPGSVDELHRLEVESDPPAPPLNSSATLPSAYRSVFESMSKRAYQLWALNSEMQIIVDNALISLTHLGVPDVPVIAAHIRYVRGSHPAAKTADK